MAFADDLVSACPSTEGVSNRRMEKGCRGSLFRQSGANIDKLSGIDVEFVRASRGAERRDQP
jgi:hypothetical protein